MTALEEIKRRADEEAAAAEAEEPDGEPEPEPEPGGDPEPDGEPETELPPVSERDLAKLSKAIDAASQRHEASLRKTLGADFEQWLPCPLCMTDGHFPPIPAGERDPDQVAAVLQAVGLLSGDHLKMKANAEECPVCGGWGELRNPTRRPDHERENCPDCAGRGWREKVDPAMQWVPPAPPVYGSAVHSEPAANGGIPDPWGRPVGSRYYGQIPGQEQ